MVTNKNELLKVTVIFCRQLYKQQQETKRPTPIKVLNQGSEDIPNDLEEGITGALKEIKNNKARGEDDDSKTNVFRRE